MNTFSNSIAAGLMVLVVTIAQFNGHVADVAFFQIIGSIIGTIVLSSVISEIK